MANKTALGIRHMRDISDKVGERMANEEADDSWEKEAAEEESDVVMMETTGETEMVAAASND